MFEVSRIALYLTTGDISFFFFFLLDQGPFCGATDCPTIIVFLGILLNTVTQTISILIEKRHKALKLLNEVIKSRTVTVLKLQQLTGLLNFLSTAIIPGRTFTRMMYAKYAYPKLKQHHHIKVDSELRSNCSMWETFLNHPSSLCRPLIDFLKVLTADTLDFYTDASGELGFGCVFDKEWTFGKWNPDFIEKARPSIEYLGLFAVAVAILLWAEKLANRQVIIYCDNQSVVEMINKSVSSCRNCMVLIRFITLASIRANVRFFADYVRSVDNIRADALSRGQLSRIWRHAKARTKPVPTPIPGELWPMEKLWVAPSK